MARTRTGRPARPQRAAGWTRGRSPEPGSGIAYVAVRLAVYAAALVPIIWIYSTKLRGLLIAPPIGLIGAAATWYLLGGTATGRARRVLLALGVGLILAELTWALGYWTVVPIVGGAAIWLAFYVLSGIVEHAATNALDRRILLEYCGVAMLGVLVVLWATLR